MSVSMQRYGKMRIEILMLLNDQSKRNSVFTNVHAVSHLINVHIQGEYALWKSSSSKLHSKIQVKRELYGKLIITTLYAKFATPDSAKKNHQKRLLTCGQKR